MKDIIRGSAVIFLFKLIGAISLFGVNVLIAQHYGASTLGIFNLIMLLLTLGAVISRLGLDTYVVRVLPEIEGNHHLVSGFLQRITRMLFIGAVITLLLFLSLLLLIDQHIFKSIDASSYLIVLAVLMVPYTYFSVIPEIFRGFQDVKIYSFYRNASLNLFYFTILSGSVYLLNENVDPIWALFSVLFIITLVMVRHLYSYLKSRNISLFGFDKYNRNILTNSYPMLFTSSLIIMMGNVDSLMIGYFYDEAQVGIYSVCLRVALIFVFILGSVNGFIGPRISQAYSNGNHDEIMRIYYSSVRLMFVVTLPVASLFMLFPEYLLSIFGDEFSTASIALMIVSGAFIINCLFGPVGHALNMMDRQGYVYKVILIALIFNVLLNYFLIPSYGINGAAVATLISNLIWNTMLYLGLRGVFDEFISTK